MCHSGTFGDYFWTDQGEEGVYVRPRALEWNESLAVKMYDVPPTLDQRKGSGPFIC